MENNFEARIKHLFFHGWKVSTFLPEYVTEGLFTDILQYHQEALREIKTDCIAVCDKTAEDYQYEVLAFPTWQIAKECAERLRVYFSDI